MDGSKTSFLLGGPIFRGYVSFRECKRKGSFSSKTKRLLLTFLLSSDKGWIRVIYFGAYPSRTPLDSEAMHSVKMTASLPLKIGLLSQKEISFEPTIDFLGVPRC